MHEEAPERRRLSIGYANGLWVRILTVDDVCVSLKAHIQPWY
jgi:hypothetical protein